MKRLAAGLAGIGLFFAAKTASAFCGFYVAGADAQLVADASQVVMMREGTRTVLAMQNDYKGPPANFAMVVPVPVVLQKENVKTLPPQVFARVEKLSAPRLVEYWEQDPCAPEGIGLGNIGTIGQGSGQGFGSGSGRLGGSSVTIEAEFEVGEYEVVILSAKDAAGLDAWLKENGYKIPDGSEPFFRPYVQAGSKFFVAKVNVAKVKMENGVATLSPLRFHYDTERFELPVRLGLVNSAGKQDLIVNILAPNKRYEVANYPNVTIPTNLDVAESARGSFGEVYAALFDKTVADNPKAIVTEYAWQASSCDPCPGGSSGLSNVDLVTLGADALPSVISGGGATTGASSPSLRQLPLVVNGPLPPEVVQRIVRQNYGRLRLCYENGLRTNPGLTGNVKTKLTIEKDGSVSNVGDGGSDLADKNVVACVQKAFTNLTFPSGEKPTTVTYGTAYAPGGGTTSFRGGGNLPSFVLTRLHARYGKDSLGADLVFKEAEPIVGGRETRNRTGKLEEGATKATANTFQARYAIRHPWPGKIECKEPVRNRWGGPWPVEAGAPVAANETIAATKLAYVPRGRIDLSKVFGNIALAAAPIAQAADEDAGPAVDAAVPGDAGDAGAGVPVPDSKCGCRTPGGEGPIAGGAFVGLALAIGAFVRRLVCSNDR